VSQHSRCAGGYCLSFIELCCCFTDLLYLVNMDSSSELPCLMPYAKWGSHLWQAKAPGPWNRFPRARGLGLPHANFESAASTMEYIRPICRAVPHVRSSRQP